MKETDIFEMIARELEEEERVLRDILGDEGYEDLLEELRKKYPTKQAREVAEKWLKSIKDIKYELGVKMKRLKGE